MKIRFCNQPLGLPRGSVRSVLALTVVVGGVVAAFINPEAADALLPAGGVVLAFYFKERAQE